MTSFSFKDHSDCHSDLLPSDSYQFENAVTSAVYICIMVYTCTEQFVEKQLELFAIERDAEVKENLKLRENVSGKQLQAKGVCILNLSLHGICSGLYGRTVASFESKNPSSKQLPSTNLSAGDIVGIFLNSATSYSEKEQVCTGVVSNITSNLVEVAFDSGIEDTGLHDLETYKILQLANDITYKRIRDGLNYLKTYNGPANMLLSILFGSSKLSSPITSLHPSLTNSDGELCWYNPNLDESQKQAVKFALHQRELAIIHGPPGTGKTTTVVEIILQTIKSGSKILACAPSNVAVDNILEKLIKYQSVKCVRLGHPTRTHSHLQNWSLDAAVAASDAHAIVNDVRKELNMQLKLLLKSKRRAPVLTEIKSLRRELRKHESKSIQDILSHSDVILSTLTSATNDGPLKFLQQGHFDCVVVDECSQATEAACWLALSHSRKVLLAGDHLQLPPTVLSREAEKQGLGLSLMERILSDGEEKRSCVKILTTQYRMNERIMTWTSKKFYGDKLEAHPLVANRLLCHLPGVTETEDTIIPLLLIDTAGCDLSETATTDEGSRANPGEATLVTVHARRLIQAGVATNDIAIITPYNQQVDLLKQLMSEDYPDMEIRSVDGFQGREKEAVILSLVRSNVIGQIGFLADIRRLNVAVTRARRHLCVVTDSGTTREVAGGLLQHIEEFGEIRSAHQYSEIDNFSGPNVGFKPGKANQNVGFRNIALSNECSEKIQIAKKDSKYNKSYNTATDNTKEKMKDILTKFLGSLHTTLELSPSLSPLERKIVHELADEFSLHHESIGDNKQRRIVISKLPTKSDERSLEVAAKKVDIHKTKNSVSDNVSLISGKQKVVASQAEKGVEKVKENRDSGTAGKTPAVTNNGLKDIGQSVMKCVKCCQDIPSSNLLLHQLRCDERNSQNKGVKHGRGTKSFVKPLPQMAEGEDFDQLLMQFQKLDNVCNYSCCRARITSLGETCRFCNIRFCFSHHMPEIHGCGKAVRRHAKSASSMRLSVLKSAHTKSDATKRLHLQKKLDNKINDLATKRKGNNAKTK